jgi:hypothetical protein
MEMMLGILSHLNLSDTIGVQSGVFRQPVSESRRHLRCSDVNPQKKSQAVLCLLINCPGLPKTSYGAGY